MTQTTTAGRAGTVRLGDIEVNRLGFGAMRITGDGVWGPPEDRDEAIRVLRRAAELDVQLIDTADSYGPDVSEELIAEALHPYPEGVVIATKGGLTRPGPGDWRRDGRPEHLRGACEDSLRRLRVDQIDLYQLHSPDDNVPYEESVGALVELKDEGKIARIGVSNVNSEELATARGLTDVVSVQNRFNLSDRSNEDVLETCTDDGLAFLPWFPLGSGKPADVASEIARDRGVNAHQVAIAWLLARSPVVAPIPGTSSVDHLEENVAAAELELSDEELERLSEAA
ncbi:MAG: aldo/keto reductase [Actinomycetota bacterium]